MQKCKTFKNLQLSMSLPEGQEVASMVSHMAALVVKQASTLTLACVLFP